MRPNLLLLSGLLLPVAHATAQTLSLADELDPARVDPKTLVEGRMDATPPPYVEALPPGLVEIERRLWRDRSNHELALRNWIRNAVKQRNMLLRQAEKGNKKGAKAAAKLEEQGALVFPDTLLVDIGGWRALAPSSPGWAQALDRVLIELYDEDPRRWCAADLELAKVFHFQTRLRLTLRDALMRGDVERARDCERRWRRWVFEAHVDCDGLTVLPPVRESRHHAPPSYLPAAVAARESFPEHGQSSIGRDLTTWRRSVRVEVKAARDRELETLARVRDEVRELDEKLETARLLGDQATLQKLEREREDKVRRLVDAQRGDPGFQKRHFKSVAPGSRLIHAHDYSLNSLAFPHYAPFSLIGETCAGLHSHASTLLSGAADGVPDALKSPADPEVVEEWLPLLAHLKATEAAVREGRYVEAHELATQLRNWVLDPDEGTLAAGR